LAEIIPRLMLQYYKEDKNHLPQTTWHLNLGCSVQMSVYKGMEWTTTKQILHFILINTLF